MKHLNLLGQILFLTHFVKLCTAKEEYNYAWQGKTVFLQSVAITD